MPAHDAAASATHVHHDLNDEYPRAITINYPLTWLTGYPADLDVPSHHVGDRRLTGGRPPRALWERLVL
jgi:hypothetical protein